MQVSKKPMGNVQRPTISNAAKSKSFQVVVNQPRANSLKDYWDGDPSIAAVNTLQKPSQSSLT